LRITGVEYTPQMLQLARARNIQRCELVQGDVRQLPLADVSYDVAVTERCIINVMHGDDQAQALREVHRILRPGGHFICIEAFVDGLEQLNEARQELGLSPNTTPHHNIWFEKDWFLRTIEPLFAIVDAQELEGDVPPANFLSSHYFISRVVYPALTKSEVRYNTHFVRFFAGLPPVGNYSPIQLYLLRRK
jgi:SAM-dependent methyltransferase